MSLEDRLRDMRTAEEARAKSLWRPTTQELHSRYEAELPRAKGKLQELDVVQAVQRLDQELRRIWGEPPVVSNPAENESKIKAGVRRPAPTLVEGNTMFGFRIIALGGTKIIERSETTGRSGGWGNSGRGNEGNEGSSTRYWKETAFGVFLEVEYIFDGEHKLAISSTPKTLTSSSGYSYPANTDKVETPLWETSKEVFEKNLWDKFSWINHH